MSNASIGIRASRPIPPPPGNDIPNTALNITDRAGPWGWFFVDTVGSANTYEGPYPYGGYGSRTLIQGAQTQINLRSLPFTPGVKGYGYKTLWVYLESQNTGLPPSWVFYAELSCRNKIFGGTTTIFNTTTTATMSLTTPDASGSYQWNIYIRKPQTIAQNPNNQMTWIRYIGLTP